MVAYLQPETIWIYPRFLFKMKELAHLTQKSQSKMYFLSQWIQQGVGPAVFGKGFIAVLQEMYTSALNSHIRLKDQHQEEHRHCILQLAPHHMLALTKNVPHGSLSFMPMTL